MRREGGSGHLCNCANGVRGGRKGRGQGWNLHSPPQKSVNSIYLHGTVALATFRTRRREEWRGDEASMHAGLKRGIFLGGAIRNGPEKKVAFDRPSVPIFLIDISAPYATA